MTPRLTGACASSVGGAAGSVSPQTRLRKAADDDVREQARETLSRALAGEDVPKPALDAARSLFAYRPTEAPREQEREVRYPNRGTFSIPQLVEAASEVKFLSQSGWLDPGVEQDMLARVKATRAREQAE